MDRIKKILLILFSLLVLILCAILPRLIGFVQNSMLLNNVEQTAVPKVNLTIRERTDLENLLLLAADNSLLTVEEEDANLTQEEIDAAIDRELDAYLSSGLIDRNVLDKNIQRYYEVFISVSNGNSGITGTVWYVTFSGEDWAINLYLDDQEGKLLFIYYECEHYFYTGNYEDQDSAVQILNVFEAIYFGNLELSDAFQHLNEEVMPADFVPLKDGSVARWYHWEDEQYGEISVELEFTPRGFYVYFP